jgi:hypothetical protein
LIEKHVFETFPDYETVKTKAKGIYPKGVGHYYYYKRIGGDAFEHLTDKYYRYAEFYGNIFISLIAFSFTAPSYFCYVLEISFWKSILFGGVAPSILAGICIWSSYATFVEYHSNRIDMIHGSFGFIYYIDVTADKKCLNITAQLKKLENLTDAEKGLLHLDKSKTFNVCKASDVQQHLKVIKFTTDLGRIPKDGVTTDEGKATVQLKSDNSGTATVTAYSEGFISGKTQVEVKKDP